MCVFVACGRENGEEEERRRGNIRKINYYFSLLIERKNYETRRLAITFAFALCLPLPWRQGESLTHTAMNGQREVEKEGRSSETTRQRREREREWEGVRGGENNESTYFEAEKYCISREEGKR